ncbi:hypothetical protein BC939DRAFT_266370 [Gamsiella multidivaricata]|uniref:uncharacterized protein n=1 Tax=Gamsiella multidivaricata TaxID=101098 RepID=UPI00222069FD|nr:uncharacterized protein BC939DRAFT_266370 [Gamsiella multidivaricata]KAI7819316.1 hypothetical protein BC939DRAFT_266370 [Gamsiella multidivaricata]
MSTPLLIKVQHILHSPERFSAYILALQLDNPSASHTQVMQSLQTFLSGIPEDKRLQIQKVFAEEEVSDSMGLSPTTLDTALQLLHSDTQLYIDILSALQLNQAENMPWEEVVDKIKTLIDVKKPHAWAGVEQFLQGLHWGSQHEEPATQAADAENDDDNVLEMIEGIDYYPDEDEEELEGDDYDQHFAAFLKDVQEINDAQGFADDFGKMGVAYNRQAIESC